MKPIETVTLASVTGGSQNGYLYTQMFEGQRLFEKQQAQTAAKTRKKS